MEMTHRLTWTRRWTEIVHHYVDSYFWESFRYADPDAVGQNEQPLNEEDLFIDFATSRLVLHPSGDVITSQGKYLDAGYWRVDIEDDDGQEIRLYYIPEGVYEPTAIVQHIGDYNHNDIIHLEHSGVYVLAGATDEMYSAIPSGLKIYRQDETTEEIPHEQTTATTIEEPIGFDGLQTNIKRHEYHGMGAEVSLGTLEFYGEAIGIISDAYAYDIDADVKYDVLAGAEVLYSWKLDLSTYNEKKGDYRSISVKVGEIGVKTTFNNRTDKEVDVDDPKTIDGASVERPNWQWLHIPMKHLLYSNFLKQNRTETYTSDGQVLSANTRYQCLVFGLNQVVANEFGNVTTDFRAITDTFGFGDDVSSFYIDDPSEFANKFGTNTQWNAHWDLTVDFAFLEAAIDAENHFGSYNFSVKLFASIFNRQTGFVVHDDGSANAVFDMRTDVGTYKRFALSGGWNGNDQYAVAFVLSIYNANLTSDIDARNYASKVGIKIHKDSKLKMRMYDTLAEDDPVFADSILIHDALNVVSHAISENALAVKSDWYKSPDSNWHYGQIGGGACKALTNGYKIRGLFSDGETKRNMPLSFKSLIESLSAIDCIGWGFSTEEGATCVRVERWDWFYKEDVILTLTNVAEVTTDVYTDYIPTELKIGYKKYTTRDQYNSIDSPYGTRTFINGIKAVSKTVTKECDFIADNYAIEETRRARTQKNETEESSYDENIFVFELVRFSARGQAGYEVGHTAVNTKYVGRASEFINAKLTPRHMAARWRDYLFATNNTTPFRFTTGEINYYASFGSIAESYIDGEAQYNSLKSMSLPQPTSVQAENDNITYSHAKFKAEKITFSYPLSIAQYKAVLANPYGLVSVNGTLGWIIDFKYKFEDGMADFTLIAKYVTNN